MQMQEVLLGEDIGRVSGEISKATEVFKSDIKLLKHSDQVTSVCVSIDLCISVLIFFL